LDSKNPSLIDQHVGRRIRVRRRELGVTQEVLAEKLSITFQQVQKYELGTNRVSAGRLFELARALETTIVYFFDGAQTAGRAVSRGVAEEGARFSGQADAEAADLVIAFQSIKDPELRKSILAMVKKQAQASASPTTKKSKSSRR
jgi:transcriptional regulator with XRE-family HTH domain